MIFCVLFEDNPDAGDDVRQRHMPEHLAFLQQHASEICAAGPLKAPDGHIAGGMWLVEASDAASVRRLVETDPFWPTGLRKSVRITEWIRVYANSKWQIDLGGSLL